MFVAEIELFSLLFLLAEIFGMLFIIYTDVKNRNKGSLLLNDVTSN